MLQEMIFALTTIGIVAILTAVYQMWLFDRLIRWEYEYHRDQWERDGKPDGFFWRAQECKVWSGDMAKKRLTTGWIFKTPGWAANSPECRRWLVHVRVIVSVTGLAVVGLLLRIFLRWH